MTIRKNYSITLSPNPFTPFLLRLREPSPKSQTAKKKKQFVNSQSKFSWFHHILCFAYPLDTRSCSSLCFAVDICKLANVRLAPLVNVCSVFRILFERHISRRTSNDLSWFLMAAYFHRTGRNIQTAYKTGLLHKRRTIFLLIKSCVICIINM